MSVLDPRKLLPAEEDSSLGALSRDFLWDKLIIYLSTVSAALATVDFLAGLLNGDSGDAVCYVPEELNASRDHYNFIQMFCSQRLPVSQYLPIFFLLQGLSIGALHFLWKSSFSNHFNYFFSLSKSLERPKANTGEHLVHNMKILKKMKVEFSSPSSWKVFWYYQLKLVVQFFLVLVCLAAVIVFYFFDNEEFGCPPAQDTTEDSIWPFPGTRVNCIYLSNRLFLLISYVDAIILSLMLLILIWGIVWSLIAHPEELRITDVALFSYTTSLDSTHFIQNAVAWCSTNRNFICCRCMSKRYQYNLNGQWIQNDFEFFLMLLYRVDSGLAHTCKESLIQIELHALVELDRLLGTITLRDALDGPGGKFLTHGIATTIKRSYGVVLKIIGKKLVSLV